MNTSLLNERPGFVHGETQASKFARLNFLFAGPCKLAPVPGPCKGHFPKHYYNSESGKCEIFIYGGCGGNANRFDTLEECKEECGKLTNKQNNLAS